MNKHDLLISTQLGLQFALAVCLFGLLGWWADTKLATFPVLTIIMLFIGFAAGLYYIIKAAAAKKGKKND